MKGRIHELDALRGIAALYVLLLHYTMFMPQFHHVFDGGVTGVDLFFMISGFVIFLTLSQTRTIKTFIISRFTRLFPTYWVCVSVTFAVLLFGTGAYRGFNKAYLVSYVGNMSMVPHYFDVRYLDGSYWTMMIELLFYIIMALVFVFKLMKKINIVGFLFLAFCLFYGTLLKQQYPSSYNAIKFWLPLINHFPLFFAGILFYKMKFENGSISTLFGILLCLIVQLSLYQSLDVAKDFVSFYQYGILITVYFLLFLLFVKEQLKLIVIKPLVYLGIVSFPMYLLHQTIHKKWLMPMFYNKLNVNLYVSMLLSFLVILALSSLITYYVERPSVTTLKKKILNTWSINS